MKLEVGKKYKRRDGVIISIVSQREDNCTYPFMDSKHNIYTAEGEYYNICGLDDNRDLVEQVVEEPKFKLGDKFYSILYGLGNVVEINLESQHPILVKCGDLYSSYTLEGKSLINNVNPTLLTLDEARAKGYDVPKQKVTKTLETWANLYLGGTVRCHPSKEEADSMRNSQRVACIKLTGTYEVEE
jgi:hypothetical protein